MLKGAPFFLRRVVCQVPQSIAVEYFYALTTERDQPLCGKSLEQAADDFPDTPKFVGQRLMRDGDRLALAEQEFGQALVETMKGDFLDEQHQFCNSLGEQVKDEVAKNCISGNQSFEQFCGKDEQA